MPEVDILINYWKSTLFHHRFIMDPSAIYLVEGAAGAHDWRFRTVEQYACKEIMPEGGSQRDAAIAFLHGFILGKSGSSQFNLDELTKLHNSRLG